MRATALELRKKLDALTPKCYSHPSKKVEYICGCLSLLAWVGNYAERDEGGIAVFPALFALGGFLIEHLDAPLKTYPASCRHTPCANLRGLENKMVKITMRAGIWNCAAMRMPTMEEAILIVERALVVVKLVGYWHFERSGEQQLLHFLDCIQQRKPSDIRFYVNTGWSRQTPRGKALESLGDAVRFLESWVNRERHLEESVLRIQGEITHRLSVMCEIIARSENRMQQFPIYMESIFRDLMKLSPIE